MGYSLKSLDASTSPNENPAAQSPPMAKMEIPPIFKMAMTKDDLPIILFPEILIKKATTNRKTPKIGTQILSSPTSNNCKVYEPNVRATRLSLMTIEKAINNAPEAVNALLP